MPRRVMGLHSPVEPNPPIGTLIRVLPSGVQPPEPTILEAQNIAMFKRYQLEYPMPQNSQSWAFDVQHAYLRPWHTLAQAFEGLGDHQRAAANRRRARAMSPGRR